MAQDEYRNQESSLSQRVEILYSKLTQMQQDYDIETRSEEKFRLNVKLEETRQALTEAEKDYRTTKVASLQAELVTLRRNKAYQEALDVARQIQQTSPAEPRIQDEINELQARLEQGQQAQQTLAQLTAHFAQLAPIINDLANVLNPRNEHELLPTINTMAQNFLAGTLDATAFITICRSLLSNPASDARASSAHQYTKLAERIRKGQTVLFLGSSIPRLYDSASGDEGELANRLAEEIHYQNFKGGLSSIAEYYQLLPEYGRTSLLENLYKSLPHQRPPNLYDSLARIPTSLVLISSAYDNLLENAFRAAGKPFVEMASIINPSEDYKLGYVVVKYSDNAQPECLCPQEELSKLDLLAKYSILYKIRGTCDENHVNGSSAWRDALTLSESNYFTFAENASKIIPDYLTRQFRDRGFLFIGFTPSRWEDRLLARALLLKRRNHAEPCYTIGKSGDPLQTAFWENQNVRQYEMEFAELDKHLQEATQ
ncbi:MAG: SIR2 family protein [Gammaproteobacteria bacterium]|nr:SIR2 family protein [Gammaproteobacteria bacterium]MBU2004396.1 SIR2 family protein [Gammaproteobacteria bacterium]